MTVGPESWLDHSRAGASKATSTPSNPCRAELALEQHPERLVEVREHRVERNVYDQRHPELDPNRQTARRWGKFRADFGQLAASIARQDARVRQAVAAQPLAGTRRRTAPPFSLRSNRRGVPRASISASQTASSAGSQVTWRHEVQVVEVEPAAVVGEQLARELVPARRRDVRAHDAPVRVDHDPHLGAALRRLLVAAPSAS